MGHASVHNKFGVKIETHPYSTNRGALMRRFLLLAIFLSLAACGPIPIMPSSVTAQATTGCAFDANDMRAQPKVVWSLSARGSYPIELADSVAAAARARVCGRLYGESIAVKSTLFITDMDCRISGFFNISYFVPIRGRLQIGNQWVEIRANHEHSTISGARYPGCQEAVNGALDRLAEAVVKELDLKAKPQIDPRSQT